MSREHLPGQVITYPYLWSWQNERDETEGRKKPTDPRRRGYAQPGPASKGLCLVGSPRLDSGRDKGEGRLTTTEISADGPSR